MEVEGEVMDDLISRQAAVDAIADISISHFSLDDSFEYFLDALKVVKDKISNLPSAQQWIPFTLRKPDAEEKEMNPDYEYILDGKLPINGQQILVNIKYHGHEKVQVDEYYDDDGCYLDSGYEIGTEATHWMPMPEAVQEDSYE